MSRYKYSKPACLLVLGIIMGVQIFFWQYDEHSSLTLVSTTTSTTSFQPNKLMLHLPYGEQDDFGQGKSCFYQGINSANNNANANGRPRWHPSSILSLLSSYNAKDNINNWACQECNHGKCQPLQPLGRCSPPPLKDLQVPRIMSQKSPFTNHKSHTLVFGPKLHSSSSLSSTAMTRQAISSSISTDEMPVCSGTLSLPCFDLSRCSRFGPIKVYPYSKTVEKLLDSAIRQTHGQDLIIKTSNPQNACLVVVASKEIMAETSQQQLLMGTTNRHWKGGQNHYIYDNDQNSIMMAATPPPRFGMAAISQAAMEDTYLREGYDMPLGLYPSPKWQKPQHYEHLSIHRKRRLLLSFRGAINSHHSWIASEYWIHQTLKSESQQGSSKKYDDDVHVQMDCGIRDTPRSDGVGPSSRNSDNKILDSDEETKVVQEILWNSTFHFCPGGGRGTANSIRLAQALAADAIPVVTSDFVAPFHPDIDWSNCLVRVSEARVVDVPNIVRSIPAAEVHARLEECKMLNEKVFGIDPTQQFTVAMQIWAIRIKNALRSKFEIADTVLA